jgi:Transposase and inactivated derivatives
MSGQIRYSDEFKIDAVAQVTARVYSVKEGAERLGISTKSLYTWMAKFSKPQRVSDQEADVPDAWRPPERLLTRNASTRTTACCRPLTSKKDSSNWKRRMSRKLGAPHFKLPPSSIRHQSSAEHLRLAVDIASHHPVLLNLRPNPASAPAEFFGPGKRRHPSAPERHPRCRVC